MAARCDRCGRFTARYRIINLGRPDNPDEALICPTCDQKRHLPRRPLTKAEFLAPYRDDDPEWYDRIVLGADDD